MPQTSGIDRGNNTLKIKNSRAIYSGLFEPLRKYPGWGNLTRGLSDEAIRLFLLSVETLGHFPEKLHTLHKVFELHFLAGVMRAILIRDENHSRGNAGVRENGGIVTAPDGIAM